MDVKIILQNYLQHLQNHLKVAEHIPCRYSISMIWAFGGIDNKHDVYRGEDCMKKFRESLREPTMKKIEFEKKKRIPLTSKEYESCLNQTNCHSCKKGLKINSLLRKIVKLGTTAILQVNTEVLQVVYIIQNIVYLRKFLWFFIKELAKEFEREFNCLGENTER